MTFTTIAAGQISQGLEIVGDTVTFRGITIEPIKAGRWRPALILEEETADGVLIQTDLRKSDVYPWLKMAGHRGVHAGPEGQAR